MYTAVLWRGCVQGKSEAVATVEIVPAVNLARGLLLPLRQPFQL